MKIGVLQVDAVLDEFQAEHGNYPDMFQDLLETAARELKLSIEIAHYDIEHGNYPANIDECDGYIVTGSKKSVYDDEPWIHRFRDYVVELHAAEAKLVGICFGHQMIALALGGNTEAAGTGWGVGVHTSALIQDKPYMQPPLAHLSAIVSHKDQVTHLPPGAELLSTSDFCPNSMFQIGNHILAFQGHPEFSKDYSRALMDLRKEILGEEVYAKGVESLQQEIHGKVYARWILQFFVGCP